MLSEEQLKEFGERGYLVVPGAVDRDLVARANLRIGELIAAEPPADGHVRHHFYFPQAADEPSLTEPLTAAFGYAEALADPGLLEVPQQVQVALNIPPFSHRPGRPHIDAAISEPDTTRRMLYYRVSGRGHGERPERILTEPWYEYGPVRPLIQSSPDSVEHVVEP